MKIPIERNSVDPFYRYQMEEIKVKVEGRGGGIKTILVNLSPISHSLKRNPDHILKFLGQELGSQTKSDRQTARYIINGSHETGSVQNYIYNFIERYVMCDRCNNPETFYVQKTGRVLQRECYACGHRSRTEGRLTNVILKDLESAPRTDSYHTLRGSIENTQSPERPFSEGGTLEDIFLHSENLLRDICNIREKPRKPSVMLPALEIYLVRKEEEEDVCKYLDTFVREGFVKRSEIFKYFQSKSKVVDRGSSNKIRLFLRSYFE